MCPHSDVLPRPVNLVKLKMVREKALGYNAPINNSEDAIQLVRSIFKDSYREIVAVIGIDNSNRPTVVHTVGIGSPNMAAVSISSVFKPLLLSNAVSLILLHNHPASTLHPSQADKELTKKLESIGNLLEITMLDHIILNCDGSNFFSFKMQGLL